MATNKENDRVSDDALRADDTSHLRTQPGSEKVVPSAKKGKPVEHLDAKKTTDRFQRKPSVDQVAIDTLQNAD